MPPVSERCLTKLNPATGQWLAAYPVASETQVAEAVQTSRKVQQEWAKTSLKQRVQVLKTLRDLLYARAGEAAALISKETGKPTTDALEADIGTALNLLSYYIEIGPSVLKPRWIQPDLVSLATGRTHLETHSPRGVIAVISPWNYPLAIPCSGLAAALMAGNSVLLKPSELTPGTGLWLTALFREALTRQGHSPELVQVLTGDGATGAQLLAQPIDGIIFTGSDTVGLKIAEAASRRQLWHSLELGGSDAMIILNGCDLEKAASYALWGRFTNAGQACAAIKRLFVPARHEAELLALLQAKMAQIRLGGPEDLAHHVGPLISEAQLNLLHAQVQDAIDRGARLLAGGKIAAPQGYFYEPTLFAQVPAEARILQEETFGPVLPVIAYEHLEEAIAQVNASRFGLTACVFGPVQQARQAALKLDCGTVVINETGPTNYAMVCAPWGGWKNSGSGSSHGAKSLTDLCKTRIISENLLYNAPIFGKPMWHFGPHAHLLARRAKTALALSARKADILHPQAWLAFWQNRASTKF